MVGKGEHARRRDALGCAQDDGKSKRKREKETSWAWTFPHALVAKAATNAAPGRDALNGKSKKKEEVSRPLPRNDTRSSLQQTARGFAGSSPE